MSKFKHYLKVNGTEKCAEMFGVSEATIRSWRWDGRRPRVATANRIVDVTKGKLKLADIYALDESDEAADANA